MIRKYLCVALSFIGINTINAQSVLGRWQGQLKAGNTPLELFFDFDKNSKDEYTAILSVPQQGQDSIALRVNHCTADSINVSLLTLNLSYQGKLHGDTIRGVFKQNGMTFKLDLAKGQSAVPQRPQLPHSPFPYQSSELNIKNESVNVSLSGTITYPVGYKPGDKVPLAVMITGSGPQNRDEEIYAHKPFLVIADYLARHGIATFRYDERGIGKSTGTYGTATSKDFAADATACVDYLKQLKQFSKVGVIGHSEGGMIGFMLGAAQKVDFIVSLAAPSLQGDTLLAEQQNAILKLNGQDVRVNRQTMQMAAALHGNNTWINFFVKYDPAIDLSQTTCPVFALNGANDVQVLPESNLEGIRRIVGMKNKKNQFRIYPELNHLFQHCTPATAMDYYKTEETIAPEVLHDMATWISKL